MTKGQSKFRIDWFDKRLEVKNAYKNENWLQSSKESINLNENMMENIVTKPNQTRTGKCPKIEIVKRKLKSGQKLMDKRGKITETTSFQK